MKFFKDYDASIQRRAFECMLFIKSLWIRQPSSFRSTTTILTHICPTIPLLTRYACALLTEWRQATGFDGIVGEWRPENALALDHEDVVRSRDGSDEGSSHNFSPRAGRKTLDCRQRATFFIKKRQWMLSRIRWSWSSSCELGCIVK